ncbi:MAG: GNVR domain-containing protein [Gemmatimonadales bacterium]
MTDPSVMPTGNTLTFARWVTGVVTLWRTVVWVVVVAVLTGAAASVLVPPVYRSKASFVANSSSSSKLEGALGNSVGLGGIISQLGGRMGGDPSESPNFYVQLLLSRELLTRLLQSRFPNPRTDAPNDSASLLTILRIKNANPERRMELAVKQLTQSISPSLDSKTNLVWFSVDARWAELSSEIANRIIDLVSGFDREIRVSRAKSMRVFLQMRHDSAQAALRQAEGNQRVFYEQNRGFIGGSPALKFEEQRIKRQADLAADLYMNLDKQLEVARIDEINDAALITIIDSAIVPKKALWPRYWVTMFSATAVGLFVGLLIAGSMVVLADWQARNPEAATNLRESLARARSELVGAVRMSRRPTSQHYVGATNPGSASRQTSSDLRSDETPTDLKRPA